MFVAGGKEGKVLSAWRYAARSLVSSRGFTIGALLTFALGIGANIAIFAVVDRVLFRPLPFRAPDRLAIVVPISQKTGQMYFAFPKVLAVEARQSATAIDDIAFAGNTRTYYLNGPDNPPLHLTEASFNVLAVLGVQPVAGRSFGREDALLGLRAVLLREEVWRRDYGADPQIASHRLIDTSGPAVIVGVLPAGFVVPSVNWATKSDGLILAKGLLNGAAGPHQTTPPIFVRLRANATVGLLQRQLDALVAAMQIDRPDSMRVRVLAQSLQRGMFWNCRMPLSMLFGGGILVWFVTCTNLGTLMAARARTRQQEFSIRLSLGASRARVLSLVVAEGAWLCGAGSAVALLVLVWVLRGLAAIIPSFVQPLVLTSIDERVVMFVLLTAAGGTLVSTAYPAWTVCRLDARTALQTTSAAAPPRRRTGRGLLVVESAIASVLVLAGALTARSLVGLVTTKLGFEPTGMYAVTVSVPGSMETAAPVRLAQRIIETLRTQGEGCEVTAVDVPVESGEVPDIITDALGRQVVKRRVFDRYVEVMRTPLLAGRLITELERRQEAAVAVASVGAVRVLWPGIPIGRVVGRRLEFEGEPARRLVGVVADTRPRHGLAITPEVLVPAGPDLLTLPTFLVRPSSRRSFDIRALRNAVRTEHGGQAVVHVSRVSEQLEPWLQNPKLYAGVFGVFAAIALLLSAVGLFAVTDFEVSSRQHEIGVRLAVGGTEQAITRMLVEESVRPVAIGVALGSVAAFCMAGPFQSMLSNADAKGLGNYLLVAAVLLTTALVSAWWAAQRTRAVDPIAALRTQ
jgi:putative ABC transport system permease protein